jgi:hypothetical protein
MRRTHCTVAFERDYVCFGAACRRLDRAAYVCVFSARVARRSVRDALRKSRCDEAGDATRG